MVAIVSWWYSAIPDDVNRTDRRLLLAAEQSFLKASRIPLEIIISYTLLLQRENNVVGLYLHTHHIYVAGFRPILTSKLSKEIGRINSC